MHASRKSYGHNCILETKICLGFSPSFGKDSDDEVATEQLHVSAIVDVQVDVTFMPHDDPEISL